MKVVFLCSGAGKRMHPISGDKSLLRFLGKTLLEHQMEKALAAGLDEFVLVGNRGNIDRLREISTRFSSARIALALQRESSGMADALLSARGLIDDSSIVVNPGWSAPRGFGRGAANEG